MMPYYDHGVFKLLVFDKYHDLDKVNINKLLNLDNSSRPNHGLPDPMMNACFINDDNIFINVYHTHTFTMWHFIYSFKEKKMLSKAYKTYISEATLNFPITSFFNSKRNLVHIFFR